MISVTSAEAQRAHAYYRVGRGTRFSVSPSSARDTQRALQNHFSLLPFPSPTHGTRKARFQTVFSFPAFAFSVARHTNRASFYVSPLASRSPTHDTYNLRNPRLTATSRPFLTRTQPAPCRTFPFLHALLMPPLFARPMQHRDAKVPSRAQFSSTSASATLWEFPIAVRIRTTLCTLPSPL